MINFALLLKSPLVRYGIAGVMGIAVGSFYTYRWASKHETNALNALEIKQAQREAIISENHRKSLEESVAKADSLGTKVEELDTRYSKELQDAKDESDRLRDDLSTHARRLSVRAVCPKTPTGGINLSENPGAAGVDAGEVQRVVIHDEDAAGLTALAADADQLRVRLAALQEFVEKLRSEYNR